MGSPHIKAIEQRHGIAREAPSRIGRIGWLIAPSRSTVIVNNDAKVIREIVANPIPEGMILSLTADQQQRFPFSFFLVKELRSIWDGDEGHGILLFDGSS
jgi:hypothetical protein